MIGNLGDSGESCVLASNLASVDGEGFGRRDASVSLLRAEGVSLFRASSRLYTDGLQVRANGDTCADVFGGWG